MMKRTDTTDLKLCLRQNCREHLTDPSWSHLWPRPRPVYAAAERGMVGR